jgi:hypothetical protein
MCRICSYLTGNTYRTSTVCYGDNSTFLCAEYVHTSQETHIGPPRSVTGIILLFWICSYLTGNTYRASTVCYGDNSTFLCAEYVHTSQETHIRASTVCYGDSFFFLLLILRSVCLNLFYEQYLPEECRLLGCYAAWLFIDTAMKTSNFKYVSGPDLIGFEWRMTAAPQNGRFFFINTF